MANASTALADITITGTSVRKPRRSRKAPSVKAQVVIQRASGLSKSKIAQDLGITRPTVNAILEESNIERILEDGRLQGAKLIPKALKVMEDRLDKGSEPAGMFVLSKTIWNPDNQGHGSGKMTADIHLNQALQILVRPAKQGESSNTTSSKDIQVIDSNTLAESATFSPTDDKT